MSVLRVRFSPGNEDDMSGLQQIVMETGLAMQARSIQGGIATIALPADHTEEQRETVRQKFARIGLDCID